MTDSTNWRITQLRELIDEHGTDAVARAAGYTPRTLLEYAGNSARVIPLGKLVQAQRKLASNYVEHQTND